MTHPSGPQWSAPGGPSGPAQPVGTTHLVLSWVAAVLSGLYMLPWAIAATRQKESTVKVAVVNFLAGWTIIGWIVALVMACT